MKTYKITTIEEPHGHRMVVHGLRDLYGTLSEPNPEGHDWYLSKYDYDKSVPPFWSSGVCETRCFTLPFAIYLNLYDLCQVHDDLQDGDELVLEYEGQTYVTVVNTWPVCPTASEAEQSFRTKNNIPEEKKRTISMWQEV